MQCAKKAAVEKSLTRKHNDGIRVTGDEVVALNAVIRNMLLNYVAFKVQLDL